MDNISLEQIKDVIFKALNNLYQNEHEMIVQGIS